MSTIERLYCNQKVLEMRRNLKHKIIEEFGPIDRIVEEAFHVINNESQSNDLIINLSSIRNQRKVYPWTVNRINP